MICVIISISPTPRRNGNDNSNDFVFPLLPFSLSRSTCSGRGGSVTKNAWKFLTPSADTLHITSGYNNVMVGLVEVKKGYRTHGCLAAQWYSQSQLCCLCCRQGIWRCETEAHINRTRQLHFLIGKSFVSRKETTKVIRTLHLLVKDQVKDQVECAPIAVLLHRVVELLPHVLRIQHGVRWTGRAVVLGVLRGSVA